MKYALKKMAPSLLVAGALSLSLLTAQANGEQGQSFSPYVDADGNISLPKDFNTKMVHLGAWFVPEGSASGFHDVYTEKASLEAFRKTGKFPDGATLIKELRSSKSGSYTTGQNVSHATSHVKLWFVMIKDAKGRFADNPQWGNGWGWAKYMPDDPSKNVAKSFKNACLACHIPAKKTDWVYTEAYPILRQK